MALTPGSKLGPYEILSLLGSGGMGEVYRARDTKLKREVAVKVLPEIFATDGARKLRFEREAELLASLNHPNIAHLYGLEDAGAMHALIMELVNGATLAERIAQGPMALEEAGVLAKQIADGLEYAHDRGIIHRDLKPANIKVTPDGQTKILDFGLAKALAGDSAEGDIATSPTISVAATTAGVLLGTAGYMSPEQAKGKSVDRRADIWAFGCVLYEMLTGMPAFDGETITDKLASVVRGEPDLSRLPKKSPQRIRELVQRCLIKDPKQRLQAIGEARIALDQWLSHPEEENPATVGAAAMSKKWIWILGVVASTTTLLAITFGWTYRNRAPTAGRVVRAYIRAMPNSNFVVSGTAAAGFALSPDGQQLAYAATISGGKVLLWVRPIDSMKARALEGTDGAGFPFWSPDGRFIGFFAAGKLKKIEASGGGPPLTICDAPQGRGGTWNREGIILLTPGPSLPVYRVSAAGGKPVAVTALDQAKHEQSHRWPFFLPDGRHFLYVAGGPFTPKENPTNTVMVGSIDSKETKPLFSSYVNAIYASGRLLFLRQNTLMAQPFDVQRLELTGDPVPLADPVFQDESRILGLFSASDNGVLTYVEGAGAADRQLTWFDRKGTKLGELMGPDAYTDAQISPDGKKVFFTIESPASDIWTYDLARGMKTRMTFAASTSGANNGVVVSPDGRRMAYTSHRNGIFSIFQGTTDGSGKEDLVVDGSSSPAYPNDWSPDGKLLAYYVSVAGVYEIWMASFANSRKPYPFLQSQFSHVGARFSPDGKFVTYFSTESGRPEVYVVPFPGPGGKWQVSTGGGSWPRWGRNGKEIFYLSPDNRIMSVEVKHGSNSFEIGTARALFETRPYRSGGASFDVSPDSQRFLVTYSLLQANVSIALIENWDLKLITK
jgi:Tol biopolymer transport system component